jgi:hypothetical protein
VAKKIDLRGADAEVLQILALQSGDSKRVRRVLNGGAALTPAVAAHLLPLLASEKSAVDAMHALRVVAPHRPGVLIDALLDVRRPAAVRRRLARVLSACRSPAVVEALLQACEDDHVSVRVQSARTLFAIHRRHPDLEIDADHVIQLINREIASGIAHVGLLFTLLAVIFPAAAIRAAYRSLRAGNAHATGTAQEYLDSVLPVEIRRHMDRILARVQSAR